MAQYYYDKNGNYGGKILSEEEEGQRGCLQIIGGALLVLGFVIYEYWYIIVPIAVVILIIYFVAKSDKESNKDPYEGFDYQPTPKPIEKPRWVSSDDPTKVIELNVGCSYIATYPDGHEVLFWYHGGHPPKIYFDGDFDNLIPFSQIEEQAIDIRQAI